MEDGGSFLIKNIVGNIGLPRFRVGEALVENAPNSWRPKRA